MSTEFEDGMRVQLLSMFEVEAQEHLDAINEHVLVLERTPGEVPESVLAEVFREAHSLKGAARVVGLSRVEALSSELEEIFAQIKDGRVEPNREALDRVFQMLDAISIELASVFAAQSGNVESNPSESPSRVADEPTERTSPAPAPRVTETVRVATSRLDALMAGVDELLVTRTATEQRLGEIRALETTLVDWSQARRKAHSRRNGIDETNNATVAAREDSERLDVIHRDLSDLRYRFEGDTRRWRQVVGDLQDDVRRARMLPVASVFRAFPRMVRDLARGQDKEIALEISGDEIEVDRSVLEQLKDPLTHLLRNCVDHGIEKPEVRRGFNKPALGRISLSARLQGDSLLVVVSDDGAGLDVTSVRRVAQQRGIITSAAAAKLSDRETMALIFRSGLSTSPIITDISGRGVGLDVVRGAVESMHGSIEVDSEPGRGTTFTLALPLSVSTMQCVLLRIGTQTFGLPLSNVERIIRVAASEIERAEGREVVRVHGRAVALARLSDLLGVSAEGIESDRRATRPVLIVAVQDRQVGLLVDELIRTDEVVIKSLANPFARIRHVIGATILGSGEVAVLLSASDLIESANRPDWSGTVDDVDVDVDVEAPTILLVDDSITTRTMEKNILESAGYRVRVAINGAEAWNILQTNVFDLVVSDVEMPQMNGFELVAKIRAGSRQPDLPVVLVTSRDSKEDRQHGLDVGADAYIAKGAFDQERLLETIRRLA